MLKPDGDQECSDTHTRFVADRSQPRYPVYIPSRDRYQDDRRLTTKTLERDDVFFRVVVPPSQADQYRAAVSEERVLVLPSDDYVLKDSRNWIRDHAEAEGHDKHHQLDDNLFCFYRLWESERIPVHSGTSLRVLEDFTDRFTNVALSGLVYDMFVIPRGTSGISSAYTRNCHIYSATLVNHAMPYRWRLVRNDDTDICLQALVHGWATLLVNAFTAKKVTTMTVSGGNTDSLYREEAESRDTMGRFEMAEVLRREWPGIVTIARRYGRYQHAVNWGSFAGVPLTLREGLDLESLPEADEYGLGLRKVREPKSERVRALYDGYEDVRGSLPVADPLWRGMPAFRPISPPPKLDLSFATLGAREELVASLGVTVDKKYADKAWAARWPAEGRHDPASLRFEP